MYWVIALLFILFAGILVLNAWVVDDAYITFRTIDNFLHGYGLRWNVAERVQVYTHPLWMILVSCACFLTREYFFTSIVVSFACSISAVFLFLRYLTHGFREHLWKAVLFLLLLCASKAFVDYASSGLENPLSYLIAALFITSFLALPNRDEPATQKLLILFFYASLAFVNRMDTLIIYLPALFYLMIRYYRLEPARWLRILVAGTLPASSWTLFSLIYYGFPFPNTAYAKAFAKGFPVVWKMIRGLEYVSVALVWDTLSFLICLLALIFSIKNKSWRSLVILAGVMIYGFFIILSAAAATHMGGRFFAVPFFVSICIFMAEFNCRKPGAVLAVIVLLFLICWPLAPWKFGTSLYRPYEQKPFSIDTKWYVKNEGAALLNWRPGLVMPDHIWYRYGIDLRKQGSLIHMGGSFGGEPIGYTGFAAGPAVFIVDRVALSDPLLARLPVEVPSSIAEWKSGHMYRAVPAGYIESLKTGENVIEDPAVHALYDRLLTVTREPLFSLKRMRDIIALNMGSANIPESR